MAWEYSTSRISFQLQSGVKEEFTASSLRVWRKDAGQWKVSAQFIRPHEE
jgi:ketosteroid isomerase-like protein